MDEQHVYGILESVKDPEVPAISVVELGVVRGVQIEGERVRVQLTPTYSGCPALDVMRRGIEEALKTHGVAEVIVDIVYAPPWTTDWISESGKQKLEAWGIAPPGPALKDPIVAIGAPRSTIRCPFCKSMQTERRSQFGPTACKALYYCNSCQQPFEHFKAL